MPMISDNGTNSVRTASRWTWRTGAQIAFAALACAVIAGYGARSTAQEDSISREYPLKAAYLYNFGSYVEWPASAFADGQTPLVIGVLDPDPFGSILDQIARQKQIAGRKIVIARFESAEQVKACHIFFVPGSASAAVRSQALQKLLHSPTLVVGESPGLTAQGAVINFFIEQNKVRFEINPQAAKDRGLKISSKLLGLAKIVESAITAAHQDR
jgi:hypothetical protein